MVLLRLSLVEETMSHDSWSTITRVFGGGGVGGLPGHWRMSNSQRGLDAARRAAPQLWSGERPELCLDAEEVPKVSGYRKLQV